MRYMKFIKYIIAIALLLGANALTADIPDGVNGFKSKVLPFFKTNCIKCHGPKKSKGKITLHTMNGDLSKGQDLKHWEALLVVHEAQGLATSAAQVAEVISNIRGRLADLRGETPTTTRTEP